MLLGGVRQLRATGMFSANDRAEVLELAARVQLGISDGLVVQSVTVAATGDASPAVRLQIGFARGDTLTVPLSLEDARGVRDEWIAAVAAADGSQA